MGNIKIIDWRSDFIAGLGGFLTDLDPTRTLALFPHNRPARHLRAWYQQSELVKKPCLLPEMTSFDAFVSGLRRELTAQALQPAGKLDQLGLLFTVVRGLAGSTGGLLAKLPLAPEAFFPWGMRLASLVEEFLRQGVTPANLANMGGEVAPWAEALLEQLGDISQGFVQGMEARGWTTPGLDHRYLADHLDEAVERLRSSTVVAAGFYVLSGTEDALFKRLWDENILEVLWHTDPELAQGGPGHDHCVEHRHWLRHWSAQAELIGPAPTRETGPEISFIEGFDLHSQLHGLQACLDELDPDGDNAAIVLPETGALLPVLHHLPAQEVNISMGYPLERTGLFRLMDTLLTLQENRDTQGRYFWRDLLELLRHPYLKMLHLDGEQALRRLFHAHEAFVRGNEKFQNPLAWQAPWGQPELEGVSEEAEALRLEVLAVCLTGFEGLSTLEQLADALAALVALLRLRGEKLWKKYIIDAEYLARLATSVIPGMRTSAISLEPFGPRTIFAVLRQLCKAERVSFEPEPLTGLQVMGVLETRLLTFRKLFVLDAVEDRLPSSSPYDPLLPDPLRHMVGLPDALERDNVSAYNFKRLLMGAESAVLLYQSGVQPGLFDSKSVRSRYVEELIWEREKQERRGKSLIKPGEAPISVVHFPASPLPPGLTDIPMSEGLRLRLRELVTGKPLSASRLDRWLACPKRFFYHDLARLRPVSEVGEEGDRMALGTLLHEVLGEFLEPHLGREVDISTLDPGGLLRLFRERFATDDRLNQASWDVRQGVVSAAQLRLPRFLQQQGRTTILALEQQLSTTLDLDDATVSLVGTLDRVDKRGEGILVLDYKTGTVKKPRKGFWDDLELWERLDAKSQDEALLLDLKRALDSVQLPMYLYLYRTAQGAMPHDAGWIELKGDGAETTLLPAEWTREEREDVVDTYIPRLLRALLKNMLTADRFRALPGKQCQWCDYRGPCGA